MPAAPTPLHAKPPLVLPPLIPQTQKRAPAPGAAHNVRDRDPLLQVARHGRAVRGAPARPARLQVDSVQARAGGVQAGEFGRHVGAGGGGGDGGVEEGVDVGGGEVEGWAEGGAVLEEDGEGLCGCEGAVVAGCAEGGAGGGEEGGEGGGGDLVVEDCFVAHDDQFYRVPSARAAVAGPIHDVRQLGVGVCGPVVERDADDHLQPVRLGGVPDVVQGGTVDRVEPDGGEAFPGYGGYVGSDGGRGEAGEGAGVGRVGDGPLRGEGADFETGAGSLG